MSRNFDGVDDYINTNLSTHYPTTSFFIWVKPAGWGEGNFGRIFDKRQSGSQVYLFYLDNDVTGESSTMALGRAFSSASGTNWTCLSNTISLNTWQYIGFTYDDSNTGNEPIFYKNAISVSYVEDVAPAGTASTNTDNYIIGNRGAQDRTFNGLMAYAELHNVILSIGEIKLLMEYPGSVSRGLIGFWPLWGFGNSGSSGPRDGGTFAEDTSVGFVAMSNYSNAQTSNNSYATYTQIGTVASYYLKATNFGFSIPTNSVVTGIKVEIERKSIGTNITATDNSVKIVKGGTISGDEKAAAGAWPGTDTYATYGSSTDKWGLTWTPADINASNFGMVISILHTVTGSPGPISSDIDHIRITVSYDMYELDYSGKNNSGTLVGTTKGISDPPINGMFQVPRPKLTGVF